jgi:prepilin-type N-terminal cleavage/methylation domain-containing protein/prepilin-type processing-associated H-X9-DG protein
MMMRRTGFTLIELLVVIAIIAILAAILFPVFAAAREKARQTECLSNVKQMVLGTYGYVQDYDEMFPMLAYRSVRQGNIACAYTFLAAIDPYIKDKKDKGLFSCPSQRDAMDMGRFWNPSAPDNGECGQFRSFSYVPNPSVIVAGPTPTNGVQLVTSRAESPVKMAEMPYPAETTVFMDGHFMQAGGGCAPAYALFTTAPSSSNPTGVLTIAIEGRHQETVSVAYADGHARSVKAKSVPCTATNINGRQVPSRWCVQQAPFDRFCGQPLANKRQCVTSPVTFGSPDLWGIVDDDANGKCVRSSR